MRKIYYILFAAQALLLSTSTSINLAQAQNQSGDIPTHQAVANLTNATSSPEDIKQMEVIGGTVNATLNASAGETGNMTTNLSSTVSNETGNMTMG